MSDTRFMQAALAMAAPMVGNTGENPAVGCVIVKDGEIVAEAATAAGGRPHAEEQALAMTDASGATAYITLEPCAQRTSGAPSCADRLLRAGVSRVVIAALDPHPFANGAGIENLRVAGIKVEIGLCEAEALAQNADYFAAHKV